VTSVMDTTGSSEQGTGELTLADTGGFGIPDLRRGFGLDEK
jgi:hypothetical protein